MATGQLAPIIHYLRKVTASGATAAATDLQLLARFAAHRDEAAFAALVHRHGPMVLGVCHRVLRDVHAAEDAFQATFLVLARKARSLAQPERLSQWLHGVAYRTAARARSDVARRRVHEQRAVTTQAVGPADDVLWRDVRPVLDEEISRLPARYRTPFVLAYLEGKTNVEVAALLGCSRGTVATLLARARERLRRRLTHRGLAPAAGLTVAALAGQAGAVALPAALELATVQATSGFAAGGLQAAGAISAWAATLAEGVVKAMIMHKLKLAALVVLVVEALEPQRRTHTPRRRC